MDNQASEMLLLFVNGITNYFTVKKLCMFYKISTWRPRVDLDNKLVLLHSKTAIWICLYYLTFFSFHRICFYIFPRKRGPPPWYLTYFATINCDDSCCVEATKNRQKIISYIRLQMWYEFRRHASFNHFSLNSILNLGISSG